MSELADASSARGVTGLGTISFSFYCGKTMCDPRLPDLFLPEPPFLREILGVSMDSPALLSLALHPTPASRGRKRVFPMKGTRAPPEGGRAIRYPRDASEGKGAQGRPPEAVKQAVGRGCRSGWGRLLSATNVLKRTLPATNKERALRTRDPRSRGAHVVDGRDNAWGSGAPGPHAHGNTARQVVDGLRTEVCGQRKQSNEPHNNQQNSNTPTTGHR